jgi:hypothetical protein
MKAHAGFRFHAGGGQSGHALAPGLRSGLRSVDCSAVDNNATYGLKPTAGFGSK